MHVAKAVGKPCSGIALHDDTLMQLATQILSTGKSDEADY
jgi:hypothetical protein